MTDDVSLNIDARRLLETYAELKRVPIGKVIRNAARDFAQAAYRATPVASKSRSDYWTYVDREGVRKYLHESQLHKSVSGGGTTKGGKPRATTLKRYISATQGKLRRVRIAKGWSRASWHGVFSALGMGAPSYPASLPGVVEELGDATGYAMDTLTPEVLISDAIHFSARPGEEGAIVADGWRLAAERVTRDMARIIERAGGK